jgi:hypothetical protein
MTIHTQNVSESESWKHNAQAEIMMVIKKESRITYNALATAAQMTGPHKIRRLTLWLEEIMAEDYHNGRPFRAAVVISKARNNLPAPGFFEKADELGLRFETATRAQRYKAYLKTVYASNWGV